LQNYTPATQAVTQTENALIQVDRALLLSGLGGKGHWAQSWSCRLVEAKTMRGEDGPKAAPWIARGVLPLETKSEVQWQSEKSSEGREAWTKPQCSVAANPGRQGNRHLLIEGPISRVIQKPDPIY